jgi:hypothetical protein
MEMNLDNKFGGGVMSIPETDLKNESVLDIKKHIGNKNNKPKQVLGEKKRNNYFRTGLKIAGGVLAGALVSGLSYKYSGVNPQPSVQSGGMSYGAKPLVEQPLISEFPSVPT